MADEPTKAMADAGGKDASIMGTEPVAVASADAKPVEAGGVEAIAEAAPVVKDEKAAEKTAEGADKKTEGAPEKYEAFKLPEGFEANEEVLSSFTQLAKDSNLSQESAQMLIDLQSQLEIKRQETEAKNFESFNEAMRAEAAKLPPADISLARKFVEKYGSPEIKEKIARNAYMIGNDVDVIKLFSSVQKIIDGGFVDGESGGGKDFSAKKLYDKSGMN